MAKYFSIGEMAKLHKISIQTLRYYDQLGLFRPVYVDQESNYRYYTIDQFSQLDIIKYLKYLGMPLKEIKHRLEDSDTQILSLLTRKISVVDEKIRELELIKKVLSTKKETLEKGIDTDSIGKITRRYIPRRHILSMNYEPGLSFEETMEFSRRQIANILEENISIFYGGVSGLVSREEFLATQQVHYLNSFVIVERDLFNPQVQDKITEISDGEFICLMYQGPYSENTAAFKALTDYAEYKRIPVDDMMYEIPVIDPLSTNDQRQLLTEIQIKVKRREIDTRCLV
ncbi:MULTISPECIES: MerR family transcriptional regulator [Morganella]|uniref:MerR family transcriptional regulator n=1 Tax=bacterium 19GA11TI05 TaxID=2920688 RepID=A0AAU6TTK2_UNCXX|nr:MerR family transcriptional regulator [Morganella morganii]MBT0419485.1 MerR family transcriptional regulator [Morganella morganii subsp. morganii]MBT0514083.1 MerR family transcriptional regulator [Morganella morganii subsp. morganii]MCU6355199.1 MerR family transcriptional regulator [Morganella morganii]MDW7794676.1 MerR family transcriptional regulator [Morganella morganii]MRE57472.1 MerR family transcriptional regulator [Morganella morganii]